jgi:transposase
VLTAEAVIKAYSVDLRERAVALLDDGVSSIEVAEILGVSDSWVRKMRLRRDALGHLEPGVPPGKERMLTEAQEKQLCYLALDTPDATLEELQEAAVRRMNVHMSISTISRRLIEMGMTRKKSASWQPKPNGRRSSGSASGFTDAPSSHTPDGCSSSTRRASTSR